MAMCSEDEVQRFLDEIKQQSPNFPIRENNLQQFNPCSLQERLPNLIDYSNTSTHPEKSKKQKGPINFRVSKIIIGQWICVAEYPDDIIAKFYVARKKLLWEFLDLEESGSSTETLKRKIEINWDDVLSFRAKYHKHDETGILEVELRKPPTFFKETKRQAGKPTQWKQVDQDFTQNHASIYRIHTLHFEPGVLQQNLMKLLSGNSFWSELIKVTFPLHKSIRFDNTYESNNNSFTYSDNNDNLHHSQGLDEVNSHMPTQLWTNDGRQINPYGHVNGLNNTPNELRMTQAIPSSSQMISEGSTSNMASRSQISNMMNGDECKRQYMGEISYGQAHDWKNTPNELRGTEAITQYSQISDSMNQDDQGIMYPTFGSYLADILMKEDYNIARRSHISHLMSQDRSGIQNMNEILYPLVGSYLADTMINEDHNMANGSQTSFLMNQYESGMQNMNAIPSNIQEFANGFIARREMGFQQMLL